MFGDVIFIAPRRDRADSCTGYKQPSHNHVASQPATATPGEQQSSGWFCIIKAAVERTKWLRGVGGHVGPGLRIIIKNIFGYICRSNNIQTGPPFLVTSWPMA
ncbi:hypothetical protein NX059_008128 [Plenodomus lindquistii]|nr:hypothetical protein NX059_008128 [Plenodomus lindquistii]